MPDLAPFHPIVVHFAIALLIAGAVLRWLSLTGRVSFRFARRHLLLLVGTAAAVISVRSGLDAHGPVERIPGVVDAVVAHEHWGERARNAFLLVALAELAVLVLSRRGKARMATIASAILCVPAVFCLYEASEHGGELVYSYAGGPGLPHRRSGRRGPAAGGRRLPVPGGSQGRAGGGGACARRRGGSALSRRPPRPGHGRGIRAGGRQGPGGRTGDPGADGSAAGQRAAARSPRDADGRRSRGRGTGRRRARHPAAARRRLPRQPEDQAAAAGAGLARHRPR